MVQTVLHCIITVSHVEQTSWSYLYKIETHGHFVAVGYFGECRVWLSNRCKVVRWEQLNKKAGFVLHKACSHQDSAGQAESGSLGLINHDLHSFIQHIQTQTHISLAASSADSSFLLLFNMWPYDFSFTVHRVKKWDCWQKSCEVLVLDLQYLGESKLREDLY